MIHPGAIGDVLLAVPALRVLRRRHPADALVLAAHTPPGALLHDLGVVDAHVRFDALRLDRLFVDDAAEPPGAALTDAGRVVCWFGARDAAFAARLRRLVGDAVVAAPWVPDAPVWAHLVGTLGAVAGPDDRDPIPVPDVWRARGRDALARAGWDGRSALLLVHPGSSGARKRWPVAAFAETIARVRATCDVTVVVHEGPADREAVAALRRTVPGGAPRLVTPSLPDLAGALTGVRGYLGNDSGISHLAAAVGAPSVVVVTSPLAAWASWWPGAITCVVAEGPADRAEGPADRAGRIEVRRDEVDAVAAALRSVLA